MEPILITIEGRIPSKKNSKIFSYRGNRPMLFSSPAFQEWHHDALLQLMKQHVPKKKLESATIAISFFAPDKRSADLTNKAESIFDLLVDYGLLLDDNWFVLHTVNLGFGGVDKNNPRAEIILL